MKRRLEESDAPKFRSYFRALLQRGDNAAVFNAVDSLDVARPFWVRIRVLYSETSPAQVVEKLVEKRKLVRINDRALSFSYTCTIGQENRREIEVPFFIASFDQQELKESVQAVVSVCQRDEWNALKRLLRTEYPRLVPILLSQRELVNGAKRLRLSTGHAIRVRDLSAREPIESPLGQTRKSVREWTDEDLDKVLLAVQDRHQLITSLNLEFFPILGERRHVVPKATCKIRKTGEIEADGSFALAFQAVAAEVARVGYKKLSFYSGRGLRQSQYRPLPLEINFPLPVFDDVEVVRSLVQLLVQYPHSMHAVHHGNPYAHVKLTDMTDLSGFEIWAVSPSRLALLPGLRASAAAFERLVDYVFEHFREGDVANYE